MFPATTRYRDASDEIREEIENAEAKRRNEELLEDEVLW